MNSLKNSPKRRLPSLTVHYGGQINNTAIRSGENMKEFRKMKLPKYWLLTHHHRQESIFEELEKLKINFHLIYSSNNPQTVFFVALLPIENADLADIAIRMFLKQNWVEYSMEKEMAIYCREGIFAAPFSFACELPPDYNLKNLNRESKLVAKWAKGFFNH